MPAPIVPFRQFVLKVASRCDLACDHCYVYEHADQSWRERPMVMPDDTAAQVADRIAEHAGEHDLGTVHVVMHGGEPLLAGLPRLQRISRVLHRAIDPVCELDLRIHTNGVLLSPQFCEMFRAEKIKVGVSIDGDRAANDRHRLYANGRSSYDRVRRAVSLLSESYADIYAGLLCTIDIRNDPIKVYEALVALEPPRIDFLLPHATWDHPPLRPSGQETAYADWLIAVHDRWRSDGRPVAIRMFESITLTARGRESGTESLGLRPIDLMVIESDGSYEQADSLKTAFDGAPATGFDAFRQSLSEAALHPGFVARQSGIAALAEECRRCPLLENCGGGLYAHRYRTGSGFANPSVYCADLFRLISHVQRASARDVHSLPVSALRRLAGASGGPDDIALLRAPQRSLARLMAARAGRVTDDAFSWSLLTALEADHPAIVDHVLGYPYVRAWAAHCVRTAPASLTPGDTGHLASIAASAAILARTSLDVVVPVTGGAVHLPAVGRMKAGHGERAEVTVRDDSFSVRVDGASYDRDSPQWEPVRMVQAGPVSLVLDDVDPYRPAHEGLPAGRMSDSTAWLWGKTIGAALESLMDDHPEQALAVQASLHVVTPLTAPAGARAARRAYGAVALPEGGDPGRLAALMVREVRAAHLGVLLDMFDPLGGDETLEENLFQAYGALAVAGLLGRDGARAELDRARAALRPLAAVPLPEAGRLLVTTMNEVIAAGLDAGEPYADPGPPKR